MLASPWTEGVRREWLAVVAPRQGRLGEEGEGADSPTSALPSHHPLDEVPLTTSFSREEIEALITARRDPPPCDVLPREEDQAMHVASPESLAAELERELTALRVHVLRSHALLHHYQSSSSQYGSRAEVSTPATQQALHHAQGVEVGVECDLCGPTCVPRPCDSTATQTPASPLSTTPECEEDAAAPLTATTTASTSGTRLEVEEEEVEEEGEQQQQQERERVETKPQARQKTIQWKEEFLEVEEEEEEEEEEEGRRAEDKEEEGRTVFDEGSSSQEEHELLLSVGGGAKEPRRPHQQHLQQQPQQQPPRSSAARSSGGGRQGSSSSSSSSSRRGRRRDHPDGQRAHPVQPQAGLRPPRPLQVSSAGVGGRGLGGQGDRGFMGVQG
ncbi:hypothetical protein O3P69_015752 [Scylla paramamosain]|uniref:Uncharacterized protein n=1 Tax=Scylla paramamosain TaxID=85552 RepID=A0AAW0T7Z5_SCYPA